VASAPADQLVEARQARESALREAAEAREAQGAAALKIAAQNTRLEEQEERLRDARLVAEAAERRAADLAREVEGVQRELAELRSSTSWKVTAPVRRVRTLLAPGRPS
jgi:DNA repair ATPase RecN